MNTPFNMTTIKKISLPVIFALALFWLGCESGQKPSATQESPQAAAPQLETGRFALQKMLAPARFWAGDAQPVRLESDNLKGTSGHDGKAVFWRATFASPGREKSEPFTWLGTTTEDAKPGVNHGAEDNYNPANRTARPFDLNFLKVDTDKAFEVAQAHGGKQVLEKDPKVSVSYLLDWDSQASALRWHVVYGSESAGRLSVQVDASSGAFIRKE